MSGWIWMVWQENGYLAAKKVRSNTPVRQRNLTSRDKELIDE
ncbi:hypothetical protein Q9R46_21015 [Paenibacillus sp. RRE4]|nr:hypothetical protein [Paenibacillus sp. RRE4]MDT0125159.1 hypothetical protein [Paenibacillus sp. RRE4]